MATHGLCPLAQGLHLRSGLSLCSLLGLCCSMFLVWTWSPCGTLDLCCILVFSLVSVVLSLPSVSGWALDVIQHLVNRLCYLPTPAMLRYCETVLWSQLQGSSPFLAASLWPICLGSLSRQARERGNDLCCEVKVELG